MKVTTIKFMKRKNLGNYEHEELSMEAILAENEDAGEATLGLMSLVNQALQGVIEGKPSGITHVEKMELKPLGNEPAATANVVKEKAKSAPRSTKPKADVNAEGQAIPPVIAQEAAPSENTGGTSTVVGRVDTANVSHVQSEAPKTSAPVDKNVVAYDAAVKEHRSRFATFLGTNYPKWKTCRPEAEIRTFSLGLHGKPFEDTKGNMLDSFKNELAVFFVNGK